MGSSHRELALRRDSPGIGARAGFQHQRLRHRTVRAYRHTNELLTDESIERLGLTAQMRPLDRCDAMSP